MNEPKWTTHRVTMPDDMALEYLERLLTIVNKEFLDPGFPIALSMAIDKMRAPLPDNKALTVEELRDAADCGIPVWLVGVGAKNQWVRIDYVESLTIGFSAFGDDETWSFCAERYGKTVLAYRRPPEKGE